MRVIKVEEFNASIFDDIPILKAPKGNRGGNKAHYIDFISAFDIETTNIAEIQQSIMYIWQMQLDDYCTVIGRTWPSFFDLLLRIRDHLKGTLVCYIHNASFEFSFLKGWYDFEPEEVFATDSRKVLKFTMFDCIEFRCSFFLSNMSLAAFTRKWGVEAQKLSGDIFDYSKRRFPDTPLTEYEMQYCINDVQGLVQAIKKQMAFDGLNLYTIPLTQTGYVRKDAKRSMKLFNHKQLQHMLPDLRIYLMLREAFRGGNVCSNRYYTGDILLNVSSVDFSSAYPSEMLNGLYPLYRFHYHGAVTIKELRELIFVQEKPVLFRIAFHNIRLRDIMTGCPYLSRDKCRDIKHPVVANGRILSADYLCTTLTDVDFKIILRQYDWDACNPYEVASSRYRPLPEPLRDLVKQYYTDKTQFKNVDDKSMEYVHAKELLNSLYGFTAQDPVKQSIDYVDGEFQTQNVNLSDLLAKHNRTAFTSYAWGVWVTANTRAMLQQVIDSVGNDFVYCDTDSVKYLGEHDFSWFNEPKKVQSLKNGGTAVDKFGEVHYLGVLEPDGKYKRFATLGAKKYAYEDDTGLHITIAGVDKKKGAKELGCLENFKEGFVFRDAGGTEALYNDNMDLDISIDGHDLHITDNVYLHDGEYTIGLAAEYKRILDGLATIKYSDHDIEGYYQTGLNAGAER